MTSLRIPTEHAPTDVRLASGSLEESLERARVAELTEAEARGRAAGRAEALDGAVAALQRAVDELTAERARLAEEAGACAATLAVEIVRQLLRVELPEGRYDIEAVVRDVLAQGDAGYGEHVVHVSPEDAAQLEGIALRSGTTIQADPSVRRGDVSLETPHGVLVRKLDARLGDIRERLLGDLA